MKRREPYELAGRHPSCLDSRYVSLATFRRNGREVRTPVWLAKVDVRYYLFSEGKAGKVKRIRANGRARLAACDLRGWMPGAVSWKKPISSSALTPPSGTSMDGR